MAATSTVVAKACDWSVRSGMSLVVPLSMHKGGMNGIGEELT
jgi:hypothetical protein